MTEDEIKAIDQRLADMSARCDAVIAKEPRGQRMPVLDFKPRSRPKPDLEELRADYVDYLSRAPTVYEGSIEQIFAEFERQFDEMAQAHRQRG